MTPELLAALRTAEGSALLAEAASLASGRAQPEPGGAGEHAQRRARAQPEAGGAGDRAQRKRADPLAAASALRARGTDPALAAAALTQVELRARAAGKFGADADQMFFTRAGLEQATQARVAQRRAARLAAAGVRHLADLCCGIGADALAAARAGIRVYAVEADPLTAAVAAANVDALGLSDLARVVCADVRDVDLSNMDGVFCDPSRRRENGARVFDPHGYSPPWEFVSALAERVPHTVLKLAPGIDHALVPAGAEAEWVSVRGEVVEAALWYGPLAGVPRRASLLPGEFTLTGSGTAQAPVGPLRRYLLDPDGAVVRAHLVAEFAAMVGGTLADPQIAYVYVDEPPTPAEAERAGSTAVTPTRAVGPAGTAGPAGRNGAAGAVAGARCFEVLEALPFSVKRVRAALRARGVGRLTIKKRGSPLDPDQLRRQLRLAGDAELTLVLTRVAGAPTALLCQPVALA